MARIYPFRALRYDTSRVRMEDVVTQPYDKITPAMQQGYYEKSPFNLIRVILGKHEPGDNEADNVYTRAAGYLNDWRQEHVLAEEAEPALYGYSQTYTVPGSSETRERRGFIALGHLYDYDDKVVYRHEQTFPKHKSDRLALFKATRAYCEQIYMLYSDPAFTAEKLIFDPGAPPDQTITDEYNVVHRLWRLTDPTLINLLVTAMRDKKLIIADGHHRYETSVSYAKERSAQLNLPFNQRTSSDDDESPSNLLDTTSHSQLPSPPYPEAAMMMTFVNMDAPGITILPTHRVVSGIEDFSSPDFITRASAFFTVSELGRPDVSVLNNTSGPAFLAVTGDGNYLLVPRPEAVAQALAEVSPRQRELDVTQLHSVILHQLLGLDAERVRALGNVQYIREAAEAVSLVQSAKANIAFLIKPVTLDQLKEISFAGEVMPQKSTDFYPKLLSGLAIYALD
jgi:uncharacterized protein (DUF1015 family)